MVAQTKTRAIENLLMIDREHDFDVIFIATYAPGRSAFNRVERRMVPPQ